MPLKKTLNTLQAQFWKQINRRIPPDNLNLVSDSPAQAAVSGEKMRGKRITGEADSGFRSKGDIFKAYIPEFLYKPPYGYPRRVNVSELKMLTENPYIFAAIKTIYDEISVVEWNIKTKDEFLEDGKADQYEEKANEIKRFFQKPNKNGETFSDILKSLTAGILELDAGVIVKVFNVEGKLSQIYVRDGGSFLRNPNIFGTAEDRMDYIPPYLLGFLQQLAIQSAQEKVTGGEIQSNTQITWTIPNTQDQIRQVYDKIFLRDAAFFQYGWTAGSMPIPFGTREIVYIRANPRYDSIYGRSPLEVAKDLIYNLVYGAKYNAEFYTNNNMPDGVLQLLGANKKNIRIFRENFEQQFNVPDSFGKGVRKTFFKIPIVSADVKFEPFNLAPRDMQIIEQQKWFIKVLWACFGLNPDEMGETQAESYNTSAQQQKVVKRKSLLPLLQRIEEAINAQIVSEFFTDGVDSPLAEPKDVPVEFKFKALDLEDEQLTLNLYEQMKRIGVMTSTMIAKKLNIDVEELKESLGEEYELDVKENMAREKMMAEMESMNDSAEGSTERRLRQGETNQANVKRSEGYRKKKKRKERFN